MHIGIGMLCVVRSQRDSSRISSAHPEMLMTSGDKPARISTGAKLLLNREVKLHTTLYCNCIQHPSTLSKSFFFFQCYLCLAFTWLFISHEGEAWKTRAAWPSALRGAVLVTRTVSCKYQNRSHDMDQGTWDKVASRTCAAHRNMYSISIPMLFFYSRKSYCIALNSQTVWPLPHWHIQEKQNVINGNDRESTTAVFKLCPLRAANRNIWGCKGCFDIERR